MATVEGYFAWVKTMSGKPAPEKYHIWRKQNTSPETKQRYENATIKEWPLDATQWELDLDELARLYPCPTID
jgi:hypothetical protein